MFRCALLLLLTLTNLKLALSQFMTPYGILPAFGTPPGMLNPYMINPMGGLGMGMGMGVGYDPLLMSGMGMNMFGNPYMANPYVPLGFTNNGNTFANGYGSQKYGSSLYSKGSPKRFMPGFGCLNRLGCGGTGFQKKE